MVKLILSTDIISLYLNKNLIKYMKISNFKNKYLINNTLFLEKYILDLVKEEKFKINNLELSFHKNFQINHNLTSINLPTVKNLIITLYQTENQKNYNFNFSNNWEYNNLDINSHVEKSNIKIINLKAITLSLNNSNSKNHIKFLLKNSSIKGKLFINKGILKGKLLNTKIKEFIIINSNLTKRFINNLKMVNKLIIDTPLKINVYLDFLKKINKKIEYLNIKNYYDLDTINHNKLIFNSIDILELKSIKLNTDFIVGNVSRFSFEETSGNNLIIKYNKTFDGNQIYITSNGNSGISYFNNISINIAVFINKIKSIEVFFNTLFVKNTVKIINNKNNLNNIVTNCSISKSIITNFIITNFNSLTLVDFLVKSCNITKIKKLSIFIKKNATNINKYNIKSFYKNIKLYSVEIINVMINNIYIWDFLKGIKNKNLTNTKLNLNFGGGEKTTKAFIIFLLFYYEWNKKFKKIISNIDINNTELVVIEKNLRSIFQNKKLVKNILLDNIRKIIEYEVVIPIFLKQDKFFQKRNKQMDIISLKI